MERINFMPRKVYLFELDSVRNSEEEITKAQERLYEEITLNGSNVVLSFNQLTDSPAFLSLLNDENSYQSIVALFKEGVLSVSLYGSIRTPVQYEVNSIEKCLSSSRKETYLFSGLPLAQEELYFLREVKRALEFSDDQRLAVDSMEIRAVQDALRCGEELEFVFSLKDGANVVLDGKAQYCSTFAQWQQVLRRVHNSKEFSEAYSMAEVCLLNRTQGTRQQISMFLMSFLRLMETDLPEQSSFTIPLRAHIAEKFGSRWEAVCDQEHQRLAFMKKFVRLILIMSMDNESLNPPKAQRGRAMVDYLTMAMQCGNYYKAHAAGSWGKLIPDAVRILSGIQKQLAGGKQNDRSSWYQALDAMEGTDRVFLAKAVVDLCYNYTIQESIEGIAVPDSREMFMLDFLKKMEDYWSDYMQGMHSFAKSDRTDCEFLQKSQDAGRKWKFSVEIRKLFQKNPRIFRQVGKDAEKQCRQWRMLISRNYFHSLFVILINIGIFVLFNLVFDLISGLASEEISVLFKTPVLIIGFAIISAWLEKIFKMEDIIELFGTFFQKTKLWCSFIWQVCRVSLHKMRRNRSVKRPASK